ncbi:MULTISPECIES: hypothetical protein [Streptococcus]|uniref:Uncharacterized protein n=1 Tax=Streptococcus pseudopneumoniae TaxID=257758 RepID=A0A1S9ZR08_9STRE|nr:MULTISPECIES: hypothetical protein [Streptococcus]HEV9727102.1 hypothetical protein [Streptococcus pneumoniae]AEL09674.1 hypothetical protein SPPN_01150 [Streptococcus pseudopneumoniae IS7493]EID30070.1 hypothetical protein HMPREF1046_1533 [Streptococcus pseudopneumoniae ATCC BAA-960 = CCUG 49455]EID69805.1 hypothetical protein HMPREF1112_0608 [Streptococcus pseudopneumoniae SK674]MBF9606851.1 hypothetical protein [Streptococcus pseudopneumoniae]
MGMKIEKIFVIVFLAFLLISSVTFLAYDHVDEELKKLIIMINLIFLILTIAMIVYAKLKKDKGAVKL